MEKMICTLCLFLKAKKIIFNVVILLTFLFVARGAKGQGNVENEFEYIDLVHFTHTDLGYTDHPDIMHEMHRRFIDIAIDAALKTTNNSTPFCWTAEVLGPVYDWWNEADNNRKNDLLKVIRSGQFEVCGIPYNFDAFLGENEIKTVKSWIPLSLWKKFDIKTGIQNDVNGVTRALAMQFLDNGGKYLFTGINYHWGGVPFERPSGFWWKMPDGRKILVWLGDPYWFGYDIFADIPYRYKGQAKAANTSVWPPNPGDMLSAQKEYVIESHNRVLKKLHELKNKDYPYNFVITSFSNEWRCDNDPPFVAVAEFVDTWNKLGLKPRLNLTTAGNALEKAERNVGEKLPVYEGEWIDWWAFGQAASPRELAAARNVSRLVKAIQSPVWQRPLSGRSVETLLSINQNIVKYYEHTHGANTTLSDPFGSHNMGQLYSHFNLAYNAEARAEWLLSQRLRSDVTLRGKGIYVANTSSVNYTGWIEFDNRGFRGADIKSVVREDNGYRTPVFFNNREAKFWINDLEARSIVHFIPDSMMIPPVARKNSMVTVDQFGWPESVLWGNEPPSSVKGIGQFIAVEVQDALDRKNLQEIKNIKDSQLRNKMREEAFYEVPATIASHAEAEETDESFIYRQKLDHPRLENASREIEIYKNKKQMRVKFIFDRLSSNRPEVFFIRFLVPTVSNAPLTSIGGINYEVYKDQLPGSNKDFMAIDEWIYYPEKEGGWLWITDNSSLVTFGEHNIVKIRDMAPGNINNLFAMVYNNLWEVNYIDNETGKMEFEFNLLWIDKNEPGIIKEISNGIVNKPLVIINPETKPDPFTYKYLYENK